jgi:dienelactone hydrolase
LRKKWLLPALAAVLIAQAPAPASGPSTPVPAAPVPTAPVPGPLVQTANYGFVPDTHFVWHGPASAAGVIVWAHGKSGMVGTDVRGTPAPAYLHAFNAAGFDVVRFERAPFADDTLRAAAWLRDGLRDLRARGWKRIVAAGQSRGAWTSLQILDTPGLADAVIAISPAAHGGAGSPHLLAQDDDLRAMFSDAATPAARVAFVQFREDPFIGDADTRIRLLDRDLRPRVAAVLVIDRPDGFTGHGAGNDDAFATRYGGCLVRFVTAPRPPSAC